MIEPLRIFIGYDSRERDAYDVCVASLRKHSSIALTIEPLDEPRLRHAGMYWREWKHEDGQFIDIRDRLPFSTTFSFTRFLVPSLCRWNGIALYCDCDFLWRADVVELFDSFDREYAVQVVKHNHRPIEQIKMQGQTQTRYHRKNWSSLILWNCGHVSNYMITPHKVNTSRGQLLHAFSWLGDNEIGTIEDRWNWLAGISDPMIDPAAVHFTNGTPSMPGRADSPYAGEWRSILATVS